MKKQLVFFILIVLSVSCFCVKTGAEELYSGEVLVSFEEIGIADSNEFEIELPSFSQNNFFSYKGQISGVNYGEQLSKNAKATYDVLCRLATNTKSTQIGLKNPVIFYSKTTTPTEAELKVAYDEIKCFTQMAVDAYSRDCPENFWLDIGKGEYNFKYYGQENGNGYKWSITLLTYVPAVKEEYAGSISAHEYSFNKAVGTFTVKGTTTYDKVKSIYTQLCRTVTFKNRSWCYDAYGALVSKYAVCSGYAKGFKVLCDRENIPCVLVNGTSIDKSGKRDTHMWNLVKMDDGKWYCVDPTWGDSDSVDYGYFLVGAKTKISSLNNKTFGETHIPNSDFSDTGYFSFEYPKVSTVAYDVEWTPPTPTPIPTATPVPVENPEMGDANRDGEINAEDALIVLRVAAKLLDNTDNYYSYGDMSNDGELYADDALLILKLSAKIS